MAKLPQRRCSHQTYSLRHIYDVCKAAQHNNSRSANVANPCIIIAAPRLGVDALSLCSENLHGWWSLKVSLHLDLVP